MANSIQGASGKANAPQWPGVVWYTSAPPSSDPSAQDGVMIYVGTTVLTALPYRWDGSSGGVPILRPLNVPTAPSVAFSTVTNTTAVIANAPGTGSQNLQAITYAAGVLNAVGATSTVQIGGSFNAGIISNMGLAVSIGSGTLINWSVPIVSADVNQSALWGANFSMIVTTAGASGQVLAFGSLYYAFTGISLAASTVVGLASSPTINLTAASTMQTTVAFSAQAASPSVAGQSYTMAYVT